MDWIYNSFEESRYPKESRCQRVCALPWPCGEWHWAGERAYTTRARFFGVVPEDPVTRQGYWQVV